MASSHTHQPPPNVDDPFDFENSLLNLEEDFYQQGYAQGVSDGAKAGRTEGRQLGLEKGFQKFVQSGRLHGRAIVWANRLPSKQDVRRRHLLLLQQQQQQQQQSPRAGQQQHQPQSQSQEEQSQNQSESQKVEDTLENLTLGPNTNKPERKEELRLLPNNARLEKHVSTLFALVETDTLAKENTDEAVNDFDDRLKRAQGKAKIVERMVGEVSSERKKAANPNPAATVGGPGESSGTGAGTGTGVGAGAGAGTPIAGVDLGRIGNEV